MRRVLRPPRVVRHDQQRHGQHGYYIARLGNLSSISPLKSCVTAHRNLVTLAIESSCDDTSVAVLEKHDNDPLRPLQVHYHEKVTADNRAYRGIHPLVAQASHEQNLARLVAAAAATVPPSRSNDPNDGNGTAKPDFVTVTRGPGMRSSLNAGLNTAKGLAVAWRVPLVAVNHMQAHALTPRLVSALAPRGSSSDNSGSPSNTNTDSGSSTSPSPSPSFPFLSLLVSGGHTLLLRSTALDAHATLAATADIAVGDAVDKIARCVVPPSLLAAAGMYGPALEAFAFPESGGDEGRGYAYEAPATRGREVAPRASRWEWGFRAVLADAGAGGVRAQRGVFSFAGLCSAVQRATTTTAEGTAREMDDEERREMGREAMRVAFEHLASRVVLALDEAAGGGGSDAGEGVDTLVVSGGVAANGYLRHILRAFLDVRGHGNVRLVFPPLELCTDNALMIAWAGMEMFEAGWTSDLSCQSLRKWSLDPKAEDGGIFGVPGWTRLNASN